MIVSKALFSILLVFIICDCATAQEISLSGQFGYASPKGDAFKDPDTHNRLASFGLGYDFDVLYVFEDIDSRFSGGIMFSGNVIFGKESGDVLDVGLYGLALYGVKGHYRFLDPDNAVSPYVNLSLGLSRFATPDITINDQTIKGKSVFSFGIRPEIGIDLAGFLISTAYFVPMKYNVKSNTGNFNGTAGVWNISIGYRVTFDVSDFL